MANQVERWRKNERTSLQTAQATATERLQAYVTANTTALENHFIESDEEFSTDEFARSLIRTAHSHIETFFQVIWPQLESHHYIMHEETRSFPVGNGTVWVRPDLCTRTTGGEFVVTDWKTGSPDRFADPSLQVQTYALWAHREYEPDLARIQVQLVHTRDGEFNRFRPNVEELESLTNQINSDLETWAANKDIAIYDPQPEQDKCASCPHLHRCEAGQSVVPED